MNISGLYGISSRKKRLIMHYTENLGLDNKFGKSFRPLRTQRRFQRKVALLQNLNAFVAIVAFISNNYLTYLVLSQY